jgi:hypothetical protein
MDRMRNPSYGGRNTSQSRRDRRPASVPEGLQHLISMLLNELELVYGVELWIQ